MPGPDIPVERSAAGVRGECRSPATTTTRGSTDDANDDRHDDLHSTATTAAKRTHTYVCRPHRERHQGGRNRHRPARRADEELGHRVVRVPSQGVRRDEAELVSRLCVQKRALSFGKGKRKIKNARQAGSTLSVFPAFQKTPHRNKRTHT